MDLDEDLFADGSGPAVNNVRGRFQPKAKPRTRKQTTASVISLEKPVDVGISGVISHIPQNKEPIKSYEDSLAGVPIFGDIVKSQVVNLPSQAELRDNASSKDVMPTQSDAGTNVVVYAQSSAIFSGPKVCDAVQGAGAVICTEAVKSNDDGGIQIRNGRLETEVQQTEAFHDSDTLDFMCEATIASGGRAGKYKPKRKGRTEMEEPISSMPHSDVVDSVMAPPNAQFVSSETECTAEGSTPDFQHDYILDYSTIDLEDTIPPETSHAIAASFEDAQTEDVSRMAEKSRLDNSLASKEIENGESARQLRKHVAVPELVDEPDDEACGNGNFIVEPPSSIVREDDGNADECQVERTSQKKRAARKSKKPVTENEKPVRKCKKANEASDQMTKEPPKKFPHSTRRRQRRVSKELLETPEDDIDHRKVPMKDLILLAEYRERKASKETITSSTPLTNQSTEYPFHENDYHDEEDGFGSEHGSDFTSDQATPRFESSSQLINYQSYMKKTPVVRWSKQETELFYEAVGQFGTDFLMIQQLFPGRTRQQVKLKYKKEEREHPLRIYEAQTTRTQGGVSHFEKVIEQLKQVAAQEGRDTGDDSIIGMTGEEMEEMYPEINDGAEKIEQNGDGALDVTKDDSPLKADVNEDDDDDDIWNSYKCEF